MSADLDLPKGKWPFAPLGEVCDIIIGRTPSRSRPEFWRGALPWLSIADMNQGREVRVELRSESLRLAQQNRAVA